MRQLRIHLIRHGMTRYNLRRAYIGATDAPLCPEGVGRLGELYRSGRYPALGKIWCSPMKRCLQTAGILFPQGDATVVENLRERHFGEYEGMTHVEIVALEGNAHWGMDAAKMDFPGGESMEEFRLRCGRGWGEVIRAMEQEGVGESAVICHGGVIMAIMEEHIGPPGSFHTWHCPCGEGYLLLRDRAGNWDIQQAVTV